MNPPTRIVIVEDEAVVAMDIRAQLERMGYEVVGTAATAEAAIERVRDTRPDLVLMDIQLASPATGIEAAGEIRREWRIPVVFLTAFADEASLSSAAEVSPFGYIVKPFDDRDLQTTIEIALARAGVESSLEKSRSELKAILDSQRQGSVTISADGRVTFASKAALQLLGVTSQGLIGQRWQEILPCDRSVIERIDQCVAVVSEEPKKIAAELGPEGAELSVEMEVVVDPRPSGGFLLFLYDVSDLETLRGLLDEESAFENIIGTTRAMREIFQLIDEVSTVDSPVLIQGETGTGKELVARAIHRRSNRSAGPFVPVNCGALTPELAASQLFGHRKGAFTGAVADHAGFFVAAQGGSLFLDEIGELPDPVQPTLLRALDDRRIAPVGETKEREIDFRLVAATSRSLEDELERRSFRSDLFYRLSVVRMEMPPLRARLEDLPLLARSFLAEARAKTGKNVREIGPEAMALMLQYHWPGNVRQLKNALEFATIRARSEEIEPEHLPPEIHPSPRDLDTGIESDRIRAALVQSRGNKKEAARMLGMSRSTFYRRLESLRQEDA